MSEPNLPVAELRALAEAAMAAGDVGRATDLFDLVLSVAPDDAASLFARARLHLLHNQPAAAEALLARGRIGDPDSAPMAFLHGVSLWQSQRLAEAADAFQSACDIDPDHVQAGLLRTRVLRELGDQAALDQARLELLARHGGNADLLVEIAVDLLDEEDDAATAVSLLEQALTLAPGNVKALHNLGVALARHGLLEQAEDRFNVALKLEPRSYATIAALSGIALTRGDTTRAISLARGLVQAGKQLAEAQTVLGRALADQGKAEAALAAFEAAERAEPDNPIVLLNLANALEQLGRIQDALPRWRKVATLGAPRHPLADLAIDQQPDRKLRLYGRQPAEDERIVTAVPLARLADAGQITTGPLGYQLLDLTEVEVFGDLWQVFRSELTSLDLVYTTRTSDRAFYRSHGVDGSVLVAKAEVANHDTEPTLFLGGAGSYYHWVVDFLPRLAALESLEACRDWPILVNGGLTTYQQRMLELAGVGAERLKTPHPDGLTRYARLCVPLLPGRPTTASGAPDWMKPHCPPQVLQWLRQRFAASAVVRRDQPRRLMVLRDQATLRRCVNEAQVQRLAAKHGFVAVRLESLSFDDQAALFAGAEAVLAVHGAGCTNMVFAPPGSVLIELHPAGHLPEYYIQMTVALGQRHRAVPGRIVRSLAPLPATFWDFRVDLDVMAAALGRL